MHSKTHLHRTPASRTSGKRIRTVQSTPATLAERDVLHQIGKLRDSITTIRRLIGSLERYDRIPPAAIETAVLAELSNLRAPMACIRQFAGDQLESAA